MELNDLTLAEHAPQLPVPTYDRGQVRVGIVHLGVGGFFRAHQAAYVDRLLADGHRDWGICGVGVLPGDRRMAEAMHAQDCLYTLVLKHPDGAQEARVIGSVVRYLLAPDDPEAVLEQLADPAVRIVSLTITEGGYGIDAGSGAFVADAPDVLADVQPGAVPGTAFGLLLEGLVRRRDRGVPPFTVMSCDNIPGNGDVARRSLAGFAALRDVGLADWVRTEVHFPNSMVDRITPVTLDGDRADVARRFGVDDRWPVVCEPYTQWVLQEDFGLGRPPLEQVGVQVVDDVEPYELMKLRLLNASHQALCYFGHLAGYRLVHDVCQDPLFVRYLEAYMAQEGAPTLPPVPGVDLARYQEQLIERFANPQVRDTVARLCAETSDRIPKWLLPVVRSQLRSGGPVRLSAAVVASWARYAEGTDEQGRPVEVVDSLAERLGQQARRWPEDPLSFLRQADLFGELVDEPRFVAPYRAALDRLHSDGARATLEELLGTPEG